MSNEYWKLTPKEITLDYILPALCVLGLGCLIALDNKWRPQDYCIPTIGSNVVDNFGLAKEIVDRNYRTCVIPMTILLRENEILDSGLERLFERFEGKNVVFLIRVGANKNDQHNWDAISPESAFQTGEKIDKLTRNSPKKVFVTLGNEPNLNREWSQNSNPEALADTLVALSNGLNSNRNVQLVVPAVSFCNEGCKDMGIDPVDFYRRFYLRIKGKVSFGTSDPEYQELIVEQWMKAHLWGFGAHLYPDNVPEGKDQIQKIIGALRQSRLIDKMTIPNIIVDEIGLSGGLPVENVGTFACQVWEEISDISEAKLEFATIFSRRDESPQDQIGFYFPSRKCEDAVAVH